jgi:hypothetical protein
MADWAFWVTAAETAFGWNEGSILNAYRAMRSSAVATSLDGDLLALAIRDLALPWCGTAAELLERVTKPGRLPRGWPETPKAIGGALRRLAPALRGVGIEVRFAREAGTGSRRLIELTDEPGPNLESQQSP